jgi:cytoskeletal protein CcmA (bactofilin family)
MLKTILAVFALMIILAWLLTTYNKQQLVIGALVGSIIWWLIRQNKEQIRTSFGNNGNTYVAEGTSISGSTNIINQSVDSLQVNGSLTFENLTVENSLKVNGAAAGSTLTCKDLTVSGSFEASNITVHDNIYVSGSFTAIDLANMGKTTVKGAFKAENSRFSEIEYHGGKIELQHSTAASLLVTATTWPTSQQLVLKDKSIIEGDVIFDSKVGKVYLGRGCEIKGRIKGAEVVKSKA